MLLAGTTWNWILIQATIFQDLAIKLEPLNAKIPQVGLAIWRESHDNIILWYPTPRNALSVRWSVRPSRFLPPSNAHAHQSNVWAYALDFWNFLEEEEDDDDEEEQEEDNDNENNKEEEEDNDNNKEEEEDNNNNNDDKDGWKEEDNNNDDKDGWKEEDNDNDDKEE